MATIKRLRQDGRRSVLSHESDGVPVCSEDIGFLSYGIEVAIRIDEVNKKYDLILSTD